MTKISDDYVRFLYTNFPDDYRKATTSDVAEEVLTSIVVRHQGEYKIWQAVPEWIKSQYADKLPSDVINGSVSVQTFIEKEKEKKIAEEEENKKLVNYSVSLLALGYTAETVAGLVQNSQAREELLRQVGNGTFSEAQNEEWRRLRESDRALIIHDWQTNSVEKYIVHLAKQLSRGDKRAQQSAEAQEGWDVKRALLMSDLVSYMNQLDTKEKKQKLVDYLRQRPQQAAMAQFSPDILATFTHVLRDAGIKLTPVKDENIMAVNRQSLLRTIKEDFLSFEKVRSLFSSKHADSEKFNQQLSLARQKQDSSARDLGLQKIHAFQRTQQRA